MSCVSFRSHSDLRYCLPASNQTQHMFLEDEPWAANVFDLASIGQPTEPCFFSERKPAISCSPKPKPSETYSKDLKGPADDPQVANNLAYLPWKLWIHVNTSHRSSHQLVSYSRFNMYFLMDIALDLEICRIATVVPQTNMEHIQSPNEGSLSFS